jgi:hypothetical protein
MLQRKQNRTTWIKKVAKLEIQDKGNQKAPPKKSQKKEHIATMLARWVHARRKLLESCNFSADVLTCRFPNSHYRSFLLFRFFFRFSLLFPLGKRVPVLGFFILPPKTDNCRLQPLWWTMARVVVWTMVPTTGTRTASNLPDLNQDPEMWAAVQARW